MTEHVTTAQMERFCVGALPKAELASISEHLTHCPVCHELFAVTLKRQQGSGPISFTLAPEFWLRHEHVDFERLVAIADNKLDETDREMINVHLGICESCQEDVRSLLAFKEQIEPELRVDYGPERRDLKPSPASLQNWWRSLAWRPAYITALILIGIGVMIAVLYIRRTTGNLEVRQTPPALVNTGVGASPMPENHTIGTVQPTPAPLPSAQSPKRVPSPPLTVRNQEPLKRAENADAVAVLNDGGGTVTVDKSGNVSGLDEIPQNTRQEIGQTLLAENIKAPATQTELGGGPIVLRGPDKSPTFRLRSPARIVIISDRPSFEWEKLAGATSYRITVGDLKGHEIAKSEELSGYQTRWTPPTPLKRGEIYAWEVEAMVDGKKVVSPGTSAPQMKFKVLSESSAQELEQLRQSRSHLALGMFYAREGMVAEAEHEFQILVRDNPRSSVLRKLLKQIQSWRKH